MVYHPANYVIQFPPDIQHGIERALRRKLNSLGYKGKHLDEQVQLGMNSRLYGLDYLINVDYWVKKANKR